MKRDDIEKTLDYLRKDMARLNDIMKDISEKYYLDSPTKYMNHPGIKYFWDDLDKSDYKKIYNDYMREYAELTLLCKMTYFIDIFEKELC